eukprot:c19204_g1_i7.p1 GENE.c19204_g1_i7~~c19204_g1_i7.p1  ORF type:complete len:407 (-),score=40.94 c19204_g1_i7:769-1887(-)
MVGECCFGHFCPNCGSEPNTSTTPVVIVPIASRVELHSLTAQEFNGKIGNVVDVDGFRAKIMLDDVSDSFRVPVANLKILPPLPSAPATRSGPTQPSTTTTSIPQSKQPTDPRTAPAPVKQPPVRNPTPTPAPTPLPTPSQAPPSQLPTQAKPQRPSAAAQRPPDPPKQSVPNPTRPKTPNTTNPLPSMPLPNAPATNTRKRAPPAAAGGPTAKRPLHSNPRSAFFAPPANSNSNPNPNSNSKPILNPIPNTSAANGTQPQHKPNIYSTSSASTPATPLSTQDLNRNRISNLPFLETRPKIQSHPDDHVPLDIRKGTLEKLTQVLEAKFPAFPQHAWGMSQQIERESYEKSTDTKSYEKLVGTAQSRIETDL